MRLWFLLPRTCPFVEQVYVSVGKMHFFVYLRTGSINLGTNGWIFDRYCLSTELNPDHVFFFHLSLFERR